MIIDEASRHDLGTVRSTGVKRRVNLGLETGCEGECTESLVSQLFVGRWDSNIFYPTEVELNYDSRV